jgi:glycosyltransferase involved in cell wall biosynthesis
VKVVLFGPYPVDPQYTSGGVEKVMSNMVRGLRGREGLELHVVSLSAVGRESTVQDGDVVIHHVPRQRRFSLPTFRIMSVLRARRTIRRIDPDLVHCQESGQESYIASGLPYPTVATIHAIFKNEGVHYPGIKARFRYWQFETLAKLAQRGIDVYVPSSIYARDALTEVGDKLAEVVENPIESGYFEVPDAPVPGRVLFAGTIYPRKGIEVLIDAAAQLRDQGVPFQIHITGIVSDKDYHARLHEQVKTLGLEDRVIFRGFLSEAERTREFSEAYLVTLPSYAETSPMTVQQAMAAGKPVVGTKVGGVPYLVRDGVHGRLVDAGDAAALAAALREVLLDPGLRDRMGAGAREEAVKRFSAREVGDRTVALYEKLLRGGTRS